MVDQTAELRLKDRKILIVDDDPEVLESLDQALQSEGALTQRCADGNTAVRICEVDPPDPPVRGGAGHDAAQAGADFWCWSGSRSWTSRRWW